MKQIILRSNYQAAVDAAEPCADKAGARLDSLRLTLCGLCWRALPDDPHGARGSMGRRAARAAGRSQPGRRGCERGSVPGFRSARSHRDGRPHLGRVAAAAVCRRRVLRRCGESGSAFVPTLFQLFDNGAVPAGALWSIPVVIAACAIFTIVRARRTRHMLARSSLIQREFSTYCGSRSRWHSWPTPRRTGSFQA